MGHADSSDARVVFALRFGGVPVRGAPETLAAHKIIPWIDLLWYMPLVAFSIGTSSFYYFFFFSIIVASFSWGLSDGLRLTLASAAIYTIVAVLASTYRPIALNRLLLAPIGLLIFGYIIARWGGYHTELKNRLKLLKDVTVFSNPRFGIDRTIKAILESVRDFYDAEACLLVIPGKGGNADSYQLYRVARGIYPSRSAPPEIGPEAASQFCCLRSTTQSFTGKTIRRMRDCST